MKTINKLREGITICLVEDDLGDQHILRETLSGIPGFNFTLNVCKCLGDMPECVSEKADVILLDLALPDSVGIETFEKVMRLVPHVPIIVLTGNNDEELGLEAISKGAQEYLVKGELNAKQLVRTIRYSIQRKEFQTALSEAEKRLRMANEELEESNGIKDLLLDIITHDLKGSASTIMGLAQLQESRNGKDNLTSIIRESSDSMVKVIENTAVLAKTTNGEEIEMEKLDLCEIIQRSILEFNALLEDSGRNIVFSHSSPIYVKANRIIAEVLKNYISNAIKYGPEDSDIEIETTCKNDSVIIKVKDRGEQIREADRQNIFRRNFRLDQNTRNGNGLGLAIVNRIAAIHNGKAWVEPNQPSGNSFCFKLNRIIQDT